MPRDINGNYSLPAGNPVVTNTVISSTWANTTLSDIATAITDSLDRSGDGAMLAGLKAYAGTIGAPGYTWSLETTSGWYRAGAGDFRHAIGGVDVVGITSAGLSARALVPTASTVPSNGMYLSAANTVAIASNTTLRWSVNSTGNHTIAAPSSGTSFTVSGTSGASDIWLDVNDGTRFFRVRGGGAGVVAIGSVNSHPLDLIANNVAAIRIAATGGVTINAPSSGNALVVNGLSNVYTLNVDAGATASQSFGLIVSAGTNSSDRAFYVRNKAQSVDFLNIYGDGGITTGAPTGGDKGAGTLNSAGSVYVNNEELGYRSLNYRIISSSDNTAATDNGRGIYYNGAGGHTFTLDSDPPTSGIVTIVNQGSGNLTIAASSNLDWLNGSGTTSSGSRTLAVAGIATAWHAAGSGNWKIWGTGLT